MTDKRRKISPEQRQQLIQIYLEMGVAESRRACVEAGVDKNYAISALNALAVRRSDHDDPRWKRAVAVGAVAI